MSGRDGLGYRAKVGLLVPDTNTICQPECEALRPAGVTNHVARMRHSERGEPGDLDAYRRSLERDTEHVEQAIDQLLPCEPDVIVLGHSIDTFRGGARGAEAMRQRLQAHARGARVALPALAFLAALRALGTGRRLAALTPYWPPGDEQVRSFFTDTGYEVTEVIGLRRPGPLAIAATPRAEILDALGRLAVQRPDVIVQPGTNMPTAALAAEASASLGIPVLACNTVTYWHALRTLGIDDRLAGFGALLAER